MKRNGSWMVGPGDEALDCALDVVRDGYREENGVDIALVAVEDMKLADEFFRCRPIL